MSADNQQLTVTDWRSSLPSHSGRVTVADSTACSSWSTTSLGALKTAKTCGEFFGQSISIAKTSVQQPDSPFTVYDLWACDWTTHGKEYAVRGQIGRILPCWNKRPLHPVGGGHNLCPTISRLVPNELQQCSCSRFNRIRDLAHVASIYHHQSWLVMKNTNWGNPYQWCQITRISKLLVEICLTAQKPYQDHKWQQEMAQRNTYTITQTYIPCVCLLQTQLSQTSGPRNALCGLPGI